MNVIDTYIANLDPSQAEIVTKLRTIMTTDFTQLKEEFKWSRPVYTLQGKDVAYVLVTKQGVNFGFNRGALLSDPKKLLEGTGKDMRHLKIANVEKLDIAYVKQLINQAVTITAA